MSVPQKGHLVLNVCVAGVCWHRRVALVASCFALCRPQRRAVSSCRPSVQHSQSSCFSQVHCVIQAQLSSCSFTPAAQCCCIVFVIPLLSELSHAQNYSKSARILAWKPSSPPPRCPRHARHFPIAASALAAAPSPRLPVPLTLILPVILARFRHS